MGWLVGALQSQGTLSSAIEAVRGGPPCGCQQGWGQEDRGFEAVWPWRAGSRCLWRARLRAGNTVQGTRELQPGVRRQFALVRRAGAAGSLSQAGGDGAREWLWRWVKKLETEQFLESNSGLR